MSLLAISDTYLVAVVLLIAVLTLLGIAMAASGVLHQPASRSLALVQGVWLLALALVLLAIGGFFLSSALLAGLAALTGAILALVGFLRLPRVRRLTGALAPGVRITPPGRYWLLLAVIFLSVGWWRGLNLVLFLAYLMLLASGLNLLLAGRRLHQLRARRRIDGPVFAGTPYRHEVELHNDGARDLVGVRLVDRGVDHLLTWFTVRLAGGASERFGREVVRAHAGRYVLEPLRAVSGCPFGLVERSMVLGAGDELIVLPRLGRLHRARLRRFLGQEAAEDGWRQHCSRPQQLLATEFHGIRPYHRGDSPRWIHWRTSARRGELMVREFEAAGDASLVLVFDPYVPVSSSKSQVQSPESAPWNVELRTLNSEQLWDSALSMAATICWEWCRQPDERFTLAIAGAEPQVFGSATGHSHALRLLESLAVTPASSDRFLDQLLPGLARTAGPILVVGAAPGELATTLADQLSRSVVALGPTDADRHDFYERPDSHAP